MDFRDPCLKQGIQFARLCLEQGIFIPWTSGRVLLSRVARAHARQNIEARVRA